MRVTCTRQHACIFRCGIGAPADEGLSGELRAVVQGYVRDAPHSLRAERSLAPTVRSASLWGRREVILGEVLIAIGGEVLAPRSMNARGAPRRHRRTGECGGLAPAASSLT